MVAVLAEVHLVDNNGMPADDAINTFVFQDSAALSDAAGLAGDVNPFLQAFYNTGAPALCNFISTSVARGAGVTKTVFYELAVTGSVTPRLPLGGPISTVTWTLGAGVGPDLPREVAAVLSFAGPHAGIAEDVPGGIPGPKGDTHPAARHRGRVYLGPLTTGTSGPGVNGPGLTVAFCGFAAAAAGTMMGAIDGIAGGTHSWCVWSRKDDHLYPITQGWMDNAFDVQRRRGIKATVRTLFP
jgi:hypothetical protein